MDSAVKAEVDNNYCLEGDMGHTTISPSPGLSGQMFLAKTQYILDWNRVAQSHHIA